MMASNHNSPQPAARSARPWSSPSPKSSLPVSSRRSRRIRIQWTTTLLLVLVSFASQGLSQRLAMTQAIDTAAADPIETLVIDTRIPVLEEDGKWLFLSQEELDLRKLKKRSPQRGGGGIDDSDGGNDDGKKEATTTFSIAVPTGTKTRTTSSSTGSPSPLPSPLDGGLSANFTGENGQRKCPGFMNSFLSDPTFRQCYPLSLLLQGSRSFFNAQKSLVSITQVLDASCAANSTFCADYMTTLANNMISPDNCGDDYSLGNSVVVKTYLAMLAYSPVYTATCLKDPETSMYCFANAVTNLTNPSNPYFYYLPLNMSLPGSSVPSCNDCLQRTMSVFHAATADRTQQIANTYRSAAEQVNTICGPSFVNETLADEVVSDAGPRTTNIPIGGNLWLLGALVSSLHILRLLLI